MARISEKELQQAAKALAYLSRSLLDMGDSVAKFVGEMCDLAGVSLDDDIRNLCDGTNELLDQCCRLLMKEKLYVEEIVVNWFKTGDSDSLESNITYEGVRSITDSEVYQSVSALAVYAEHEDLDVMAQCLSRFKKQLEKVELDAVNLGYRIGNSYFKYLDPEKFGVISNDKFTVGHMITTDDRECFGNYVDYAYVLHKGINKCDAPRLPICALFKCKKAGVVQIDLKLCRYGYSEGGCCIQIAGYCKETVAVIIAGSNTDPEKVAMQLAEKFNQIADLLEQEADKDPSLRKLLPYGETCRFPVIQI